MNEPQPEVAIPVESCDRVVAERLRERLCVLLGVPTQRGVLGAQDVTLGEDARRCLYVVHTHEPIEGRLYHFYTDAPCWNQLYGVEGLFQGLWAHASYVPCSVVAPRAGMEDGIVRTLEQFESVFFSQSVRLQSIDELVAVLLRQHGMWPPTPIDSEESPDES